MPGTDFTRLAFHVRMIPRLLAWLGIIRYLRVSISPYATSKLVPHFQVIYTRYPIPYAVGANAKRLTSTNSCQGPAANVLYDTSTALEQHTLFGYFAIDARCSLSDCLVANIIIIIITTFTRYIENNNYTQNHTLSFLCTRWLG